MSDNLECPDHYWEQRREARRRKAICTNNREHKNFIATAIVYQDWVVDESGNFIEVQNECSQVYIKPEMGQEWTCSDCGAVAKIGEVSDE